VDANIPLNLLASETMTEVALKALVLAKDLYPLHL
jgi:hypothetical protein